MSTTPHSVRVTVKHSDEHVSQEVMDNLFSAVRADLLRQRHATSGRMADRAERHSDGIAEWRRRAHEIAAELAKA